jgi:AcrR family transcriptional regulator
LERGYDAIGPAEVAEFANVGRSTFYEHYAGLDDLLAQTLHSQLTVLAEGSLRVASDSAITRVVQHFWDNRRVARAMLAGGASVVIARLLAERFEVALRAVGHERGGDYACPVKLIAVQLAAGQLAVLKAWLTGAVSASAEFIAQVLQASSCATAAALAGPPLSGSAPARE